MKKTVLSLIMIIIATYSQSNAQEIFNEQEFFKNLKNSYYSLESTNLKNFTVLMTNLSTENFAQENWENSEIFPLQLIWSSPNRVFLSEQGVPGLTDSLKTKYSDFISDLKIQFQDILLNLKQFYLNGIYNSIPGDYVLNTAQDLVRIEFSSFSKTDTVKTTYFFGKNALCLKILTYFPKTQVTVETIPRFRIIKTKWLVVGWSVQISIKERIESGYTINLKNNLIGDIWIPGEMLITVQDIKFPGESFNDVIKFRNYLFDQSLQIID